MSHFVWNDMVLRFSWPTAQKQGRDFYLLPTDSVVLKLLLYVVLALLVPGYSELYRTPVVEARVFSGGVLMTRSFDPRDE